MTDRRQTILIVDDTNVNRSMLSDILEDEYDILEARDGLEAIDILRQREGAIALMLLDIVMPNMDGFEVLAYLHRREWSDQIPVIIISAETSPTYIRKGFELGVSDYVSRPFDPEVVSQRVRNAIALYAKQNRLKDLIADQVQQREKTNTLMVDILSTIVEFRNGESGLHVTRIRIITEILLEAMKRRFPEYGLTQSKIALISNAAALHDIGKIAVPEEILNKPGKLTSEEFEVMKTHAAVGDEMLAGLHFGKDEELVKHAREICRWHHERWDGRGYPDGLVGDQIPVAAQAVAMADVYDALVSERVYKKAYPHETAVRMIEEGECGAFNPALMECFLDEAEHLHETVRIRSNAHDDLFDVGKLAREVLERSGPGLSDRTVQLLERERAKFAFVARQTDGVLFDFDAASDTVAFSGRARADLGFPEMMASASAMKSEERFADTAAKLQELVESSTPRDPHVSGMCEMELPDGTRRRCSLTCLVVWAEEGEGFSRIGTLGHLAICDA